MYPGFPDAAGAAAGQILKSRSRPLPTHPGMKYFARVILAVDDLVKCFELLKYGVCFILVFIGLELTFVSKIQLPEWVVLLVIVTVSNMCIVASVIKRYIISALWIAQG